jgi:opacity protein-like surface antigen
MISALKDAKEGFELNRRLLTGELSPEKWVEELVPEELPEHVPLSKPKPSPSPAPAPAPAPALVPVPAPAPAPAAEPATAAAAAAAPAPVPMAAAAAAAAAEAATASAASENGKGDDGRAKNKLESSSYYFFSSTPAEQAKQYAPKKLDSAEEEVAKPVVKRGLSKWNAGGTWEEKDCTEWAHKKLKELLRGVAVPAFADGVATVSDSWVVKGDASLVWARGKKRAGFEISLSTTFTGNYKGVAVSGDIEINGIDASDGPSGDYEVHVTTKASDEAHAVVRRATAKVADEIKRRVKIFIEELQNLE